MAAFYLILALLVQSTLTYADIQTQKNETASIEVVSVADEASKPASELVEAVVENKTSDDTETSADDKNVTPQSDNDAVLLKDFQTATNDWVDMFLGSDSNAVLSPSATKVAQATNSSKSPEEQLEEIKEVATEITMAIQNEMTNLLSYALLNVDTGVEDNKLRKRRSVETPMDSSQLVLRLLKHIKANNEYQNIAIEKMMSAQEIADKYGVEFNPDPEILSDLAFAANEQAKELSSILKDACDANNTSCALNLNETKNNSEMNTSATTVPVDNATYYVYSIDYPDCETNSSLNMRVSPDHEHNSSVWTAPGHVHFGDNPASYHYHPYETQIVSPPVNHPHSVTPKPTFYDSISYNPNEYYAPYCSVDPTAYLSAYQFEEPLDLEPELIGEEYEETISSRVIIEEDEVPGSATVNHVMTYTVSEKAHFRTPEIEKLPQQMQYYFFLM